MPERIEFRFQGDLADRHLLDFYEAGRFQYGAARLMVKLDQFRREGRFAQKVTPRNNTRILISAQEPGSFLIATLAPLAGEIAQAFIQAPMSLMWSYVADRIFKSASDENLREALATQRELLNTFNREIADRGERDRRTMDMLEGRIERGDELTDENRQLYERLLAETERRAYLEGEREAVREISIDQDAKLISMAAPLFKDMGVALRRSASTLNIEVAEGGARRRIVFANRAMTQEIETSLLDGEPTLILVKIVQYNTETGWGKLRMEEHVGLLSFNVPSDRKGELQRLLLRGMDEENTYIECVFARSSRGILQRAIVLSIRDLDEVEGLL